MSYARPHAGVQPVTHLWRKIPVSDLGFSSPTRLENGELLIDIDELTGLLRSDPNVRDVRLDIARPGESVRIIPVKDVIEPRLSLVPGYPVFPGVFSAWDPDAEGILSGEIVSLSGMVVTTVGSIVGFQEGLIDMAGPGARTSLFSRKHHLVLDVTVREGMGRHDHERTIRLAGLKASNYIAASVLTQPLSTDIRETLLNPEYPGSPASPGRAGGMGKPRIAYLYMLQSQGLLHDTYYCGLDVKTMLPRRIVPTEVLFGAIISGNCVSACDKNTTYHHQNNPILLELMRRHGTDWDFAGCVITNENVTLGDKQRSSTLAAGLIASLSPDGVIISKEGFGNPDADLMMNCSKIEAHGIKTVLLTDEFAGQSGASQSLVDGHPKADAIVSTGNANEVIVLPPLEKVIGDDRVITTLAGGSSKCRLPDGSIAIELQALIGSTNQLGFERISSRFK
ncbi:MAG: glycine/sarcosine/betaine reductase component B subunit [Deltaproteobacteria bacterium]|nr:glycine/sarcosine/betaine reductase component B subunit [Candidatus Deferrimicrobiaceae bacterium]